MQALSYCDEVVRAPGLGPGARFTLLIAVGTQAFLHVVPGLRTKARELLRRVRP